MFQYFVPVYRRILFHWMDIPHGVRIVIPWRTFRLCPLLDIMNIAAVNIHVQVFVSTVCNSLTYIPRSGLLDHVVTPCFSFRGMVNGFNSPAPFYIPTSRVGGFLASLETTEDLTGLSPHCKAGSGHMGSPACQFHHHTQWAHGHLPSTISPSHFMHFPYLPGPGVRP